MVLAVTHSVAWMAVSNPAYADRAGRTSRAVSVITPTANGIYSFSARLAITINRYIGRPFGRCIRLALCDRFANTNVYGQCPQSFHASASQGRKTAARYSLLLPISPSAAASYPKPCKRLLQSQRCRPLLQALLTSCSSEAPYGCNC